MSNIVPTRSYTENRELSWLKFNQRVLEEASDSNVPLLERLKFVAIFTSNLDEFFMVRVGRLFHTSVITPDARDSRSNMTPKEQLQKIYSAVKPLYFQKSKIYEEIKQELKDEGIVSLDYHELSESDKVYIEEYFKIFINPVLAPQIVDPHHPFPHIANKQIVIGALLRRKSDTVFGLLPLPSAIPEHILLPGNEIRFIRTEKVLLSYLSKIFNKYEVIERNCLCITRNTNISTTDEELHKLDIETDILQSENTIKDHMRKLLSKQKRLSVVRIEANYSMSEAFCDYICDKFSVRQNQIFVTPTPLKMGFVFDLYKELTAAQRSKLTYPNFSPAPLITDDNKTGILASIRAQDKIIHYPYESMDYFLQMIKEAANDPEVISIKITIYRLAKRAKLVDYLCNAAENGKEVSVLMELRARFDEQNNIDWSEKLEEAGCKIIYGFNDYKVHSKICLITSRSSTGLSYITQVGTGNYNEKTAELYTDLSIITANNEIGLDAVEFFKNMDIANLEGRYNTLLVAPVNLKPKLLSLMDEEIAKKEEGFIFIKINSLTDIDFIDKLAEASKAGVKVNLIVRGICCLIPKIPGETENIDIISVVGRFLEHPRIYMFGKNEAQQIYIGSSDLMTRNTEYRVEVACPILDPEIRAEINDIMNLQWRDNVKARFLSADGIYRKKVDTSSENSQEQYIKLYSSSRVKATSPKKKEASLLDRILKKLNLQRIDKASKS